MHGSHESHITQLEKSFSSSIITSQKSSCASALRNDVMKIIHTSFMISYDSSGQTAMQNEYEFQLCILVFCCLCCLHRSTEYDEYDE